MLVKVLAVALLANAAAAKLTGWPSLSTANSGTSTICLSSDFSVELPNNAPDDLCEAAQRTTDRLKCLKHRYLSPTRGAEFFPNGAGCSSTISKLVLTLNGDPTSIEELAHRRAEDRPALEAYKLSLSGDSASASSGSSLGLLRALTTLETLFFAHGDKIYAPFGSYDIDDKPLFPWRAVLLDTSRNFFSVDTLKRTLDTMSFVKLSVLQWHITDSQSWPLRLNGYADLAEKGAYGPNQIYTEDDVREVVEYGAKRGVDVLLEIDTPGHTSIIAHAHPEYVACFEDPWAEIANEPPAGQLRFADDQVTSYVEGLFSAASELSDSQYFGSGGDELNKNCMNRDAPTVAALKAKNWTLDDALKEFTVRTHGAIRNKGKTPIVWEEMALDHGDTGIGNDTLVTVWISSANVRSVLDKGFKLIHAASDFFYLDCGQGGWITTQPDSPSAAGLENSWCDPFKTWIKILSFDPFNGTTPEQHNLIMGGQTSLWCEQTDETNIDSQIWPRAAAVAEVFWSGGAKAAVDYQHNMNDIRYRIVERGVAARPLQPEWCVLRPGKCDVEG